MLSSKSGLRANVPTLHLYSYGGWTTFRGLPLHAWNMNPFKQIGDACNGLVEISKATWRKTDLIIDNRLKVKENYTEFILAQISVIDEKGTSHTVETISFT